MNNSWTRVFSSHLFPSVKLSESNSENNSLLCVNSLTTFQPSGKTHNVFHMNVQVKDFEVWMSQACLGKSLEKHTTCNLAKSFIKITCPCKSLRIVIHQDDMCRTCMKFSFCSFVGTGN